MARNAVPSENDEVKFSIRIRFDKGSWTVSLNSLLDMDFRHQSSKVRSNLETIGGSKDDVDNAELEVEESPDLKVSCQSNMIVHTRANVILGLPRIYKYRCYFTVEYSPKNAIFTKITFLAGGCKCSNFGIDQMFLPSTISTLLMFTHFENGC